MEIPRMTMGGGKVYTEADCSLVDDPLYPGNAWARKLQLPQGKTMGDVERLVGWSRNNSSEDRLQCVQKSADGKYTVAYGFSTVSIQNPSIDPTSRLLPELYPYFGACCAMFTFK